MLKSSVIVRKCILLFYVMTVEYALGSSNTANLWTTAIPDVIDVKELLASHPTKCSDCKRLSTILIDGSARTRLHIKVIIDSILPHIIKYKVIKWHKLI